MPVSAFCTGTKKVLGGGASVSPMVAGTALAWSAPAGDTGWSAAYTSTGSQAEVVSVWAICANVT